MHPVAKVLRKAHFTQSAPTIKQCPVVGGVEVAFAGRSNAGKSSAINALTHQNKLAKTTKTPGRTQLINFFEIDEHRRLVDLPGPVPLPGDTPVATKPALRSAETEGERKVKKSPSDDQQARLHAMLLKARQKLRGADISAVLSTTPRAGSCPISTSSIPWSPTTVRVTDR